MRNGTVSPCGHAMILAMRTSSFPSVSSFGSMRTGCSTCIVVLPMTRASLRGGILTFSANCTKHGVSSSWSSPSSAT